MERETPHLSLAAARRIALAAQGFGKPRPVRPPSVNQIEALVRQLGVLQLDSVNVFSRAHYMPLFSRSGRTTARAWTASPATSTGGSIAG